MKYKSGLEAVDGKIGASLLFHRKKHFIIRYAVLQVAPP